MKKLFKYLIDAVIVYMGLMFIICLINNSGDWINYFILFVITLISRVIVEYYNRSKKRLL
jgi:uncharacterized membrane protein YjjP (DUF1212 family)